jgi:glutaconate CoA-transferase subunit B
MAGRTVILMAHEPRRFVERVHYNTSPGHGEGGDWRDREGVPGGGPSALVTSKATFGFDERGELYLRTTHPGVEPEDVLGDFPWELQTAVDVDEGPVGTTDPPSEEALALVRKFDPEGFWSGAMED